ncbi:solute carrier family 22 member 13 isoform X2 [Mastacembelus armatus]|uniref:solute carrier family 22 member 13 isoform X2 n=1 Tax=Mastacembelus armatus TaxID=205130 RepID=UPI000E45D795|nr:solute carrier family 22 member 13-like isoform X2 [Mastacembelus armatus]
MSPLQLSVYWRLSLIFIFTSFLFFLDIFTAAIVTATCRHGNTSHGTLVPNSGTNQSWPERTKRGNQDSVCSWTDWLSYGQTLFMVGLLLGSLFGGAICDRFGKRPVLLLGVCMHTMCGLVPAVLPQPLLFLAVRCLTGICCCFINICSFSLAVEWTRPAARLWSSALLPFCFSLGMMGGAPLAWLSPTWRQLHLSLSLPQLICLPLFFSIPESPQWLLLKQRTDVLDVYRSNSPADEQCLDVLLESAWSDLQKTTAGHTQEEPPAGHTPNGIIHQLRHPTILLRLTIMSYLSVATALTYYGICMNIGSFGVGVYSAQFFSGITETPCLLVPLVRLGRRPMSMLSLFLSGAACFLSFLLSRYNCEPVLVMSLALLGKLCIGAAIFISILYSIELFPTVVSSGPIIGCGLCVLLPETSGVTLPDSIEDCDRQPRPRPLSIVDLWRTRNKFPDREDTS